MTNQFVSVEKLEHWTLARLIPFAGNARTHSAQQIQQIAASIAEFGFVNPVLVAPDGSIIAGHGRVLAAKKLGMEMVPVIVLGHLSEAQRRALVIADNQLSLNSSWDDEALRKQLAALADERFSLELIGFQDERLAELLKATEGSHSTAEMRSVDDEPPHSPVSQPGDVWLLADRHKVLCRDSSSSDVAPLMGAERAILVVTRVANEDARPPLRVRIAEIVGMLSAEASFYVVHDLSTQRQLQDSLEAAGVKHSVPTDLGKGRAADQREPLCHGSRAGLFRLPVAKQAGAPRPFAIQSLGSPPGDGGSGKRGAKGIHRKSRKEQQPPRRLGHRSIRRSSLPRDGQ